MQNKTFRSLITLLLMASPLWWTSGCYSVRSIEKLEKAETFELVVLTKGQVRYNFDQWTVDSIGTITGSATRSFYDTLRSERRFTHGEFSVSRDSIASLGENHFDVVRTIFAVAGGAASVALIGKYIYWWSVILWHSIKSLF